MSDIKKILHLENYKKVYYAQLIGKPIKLYFVFFDSKRPTTNLTSQECHSQLYAPVQTYYKGQRLSLTKIAPIEQLRGDISGAYFIRIDLSGRFQQQSMYESTLDIFVEDMNLKDFKSAAAISDRIRKARKTRRDLLGGGSDIKYVKLTDCIVNQQKDWVQFEFLSKETPDGKKKFTADPHGKLTPNTTGTYTILLRVCDFATQLFDTMPNGHVLEPKDLKDAMEVCPIKMWDNDPSLYWQGFAYNLTQLDACIYEVNIPPKHWNKLHGGDFFLSKHMTALIMNIDFYLNNMTSMLSKKLRDVGLLDVGFSFKKGLTK